MAKFVTRFGPKLPKVVQCLNHFVKYFPHFTFDDNPSKSGSCTGRSASGTGIGPHAVQWIIGIGVPQYLEINKQLRIYDNMKFT